MINKQKSQIQSIKSTKKMKKTIIIYQEEIEKTDNVNWTVLEKLVKQFIYFKNNKQPFTNEFIDNCCLHPHSVLNFEIKMDDTWDQFALEDLRHQTMVWLGYPRYENFEFKLYSKKLDCYFTYSQIERKLKKI